MNSYIARLHRANFLTESFNLQSCVSIGSAPRMRTMKGVVYSAEGVISSCLFCRIISREEPGNIVFENERLVAFRTIAPVTTNHLLVVPREHRSNVHALSGKEDAMLIREMKEFAMEALRVDGCENIENSQYSFHVPPYNSIDHLHLHAIGNRDSVTFAGALKYAEGTFYCWSADQTIERIMKEVSKL